MKTDRNLDREGDFTIRWRGTFYPALFILNSTSLQAFPYRTRVEIDLDALRANLRAIREHLGRGAKVMAVVKANAYGHGVRPIVRALRGRVEFFGVANLREAVEVREEDEDHRARIFARGLLLGGGESLRGIGWRDAICDAFENRHGDGTGGIFGRRSGGVDGCNAFISGDLGDGRGDASSRGG